MAETSNAGGGYAARFSQYFDREVAQRAARSLVDGAEMEIRIQSPNAAPSETLVFGRADGKNRVSAGLARDPQIAFVITPKAADQILEDASEDIGEIGVRIAQLVISPDPERKVAVRLQAGFLTLFAKGYFGVLAAGGGALASFLASKGLGGMGAIKSAIKKMQSK